MPPYCIIATLALLASCKLLSACIRNNTSDTVPASTVVESLLWLPGAIVTRRFFSGLAKKSMDYLLTSPVVDCIGKMGFVPYQE
ncbi:hypothetical protein [Glaciimonas sp. GG7]